MGGAHVYNKTIGLFECRRDNVEYWLELGKLGADILVNSNFSRAMCADYLVGRPAKMIDKPDRIRFFQLGRIHSRWGNCEGQFTSRDIRELGYVKKYERK